MSYATVDSVKQAVTEEYTFEGFEEHIQDLLDSSTATLNAALQVRYVVPVVEATSPEFWAILVKMQADTVAADIMIRQNGAGQDAEAMNWYPNSLKDNAETMLEQLLAEEGGLTPIDAVLLPGEEIGGVSVPVDGFTDATAPDPFYDRGTYVDPPGVW